MQVFRGLPPAADAPVALTIGNFDGVHRGHQAMLSRLVEAAEDLALPSAVLTFDPPPREFFAKATAPAAPVVGAGQDRAVRRARRRPHLHRAIRRAARRRSSPKAFIDGVLVRRLGAAVAPRRRGFPLRQGQGRRPCHAARVGADVQRGSDAHRGRRRRAGIVDGGARGARGGRSRARAGAARARIHDLGQSRTRREAGAPAGVSDGEHPAKAQAPGGRNIRGARARARRGAADGRRQRRRAADRFDARACRCSKSSSSISMRRSTVGASASSSCTSCATRSATRTSTRSRARSATTSRRRATISARHARQQR